MSSTQILLSSVLSIFNGVVLNKLYTAEQSTPCPPAIHWFPPLGSNGHQIYLSLLSSLFGNNEDIASDVSVACWLATVTSLTQPKLHLKSQI
ncbi:hypothetical protein F2Q70_00008088 [Brassica cretica]|uniref:Uncharacterized protein n=1 Tax=Brassica cretica TaxID=69181 RepID=A0A8S9LVH9_BRACR|nr:hypothetical protein F2Q70_00008088 [Brassica cretica]